MTKTELLEEVRQAYLESEEQGHPADLFERYYEVLGEYVEVAIRE